MGAWIEIYPKRLEGTESVVAPFMGAWIEIPSHILVWIRTFVAPFMGAWIEIQYALLRSGNARESLPSWERGLKS